MRILGIVAFVGIVISLARTSLAYDDASSSWPTNQVETESVPSAGVAEIFDPKDAQPLDPASSSIFGHGEFAFNKKIIIAIVRDTGRNTPEYFSYATFVKDGQQVRVDLDLWLLAGESAQWSWVIELCLQDANRQVIYKSGPLYEPALNYRRVPIGTTRFAQTAFSMANRLPLDIATQAAWFYITVRAVPQSESTPTSQPAKSLLRIGTYDSRAVAVAYFRSAAHTQQFNAELAAKTDEMKKAQAAGDTKKVDELNAWGAARQHQWDLRAFSSAPIPDVMKSIEKDLPTIAKNAHVDLIVSRWQIDYQSADAEFIDLTDAIVALFQPDAKTQKILNDMKKHPPMTEAAVIKLHSRHKSSCDAPADH